jgi:flagellar biosynthesis anti-sigma factor FlgM|tara:strand:- start:273 stop:488 length:216 start_codon:yes stop_codon:yes gene_type:complete
VEIPENEIRVIRIDSKDIQKARKAAHDASDIRVDKVEQIRQEIADGSFQVDSHDLAKKVLREVITESRLLG